MRGLIFLILSAWLTACTSPPAMAPTSPNRTPTPPNNGPPSPSAGVRTGPIALDQTEVQELQAAVDGGHEPWRLEPIQVARAEGEALGFTDGDQFDLLRQDTSPSSGTSYALVRAVHRGENYEIQLIQPAKTGSDGIWKVTDVRRLD